MLKTDILIYYINIYISDAVGGGTPKYASGIKIIFILYNIYIINAVGGGTPKKCIIIFFLFSYSSYIIFINDQQ